MQCTVVWCVVYVVCTQTRIDMASTSPTTLRALRQWLHKHVEKIASARAKWDHPIIKNQIATGFSDIFNVGRPKLSQRLLVQAGLHASKKMNLTLQTEPCHWTMLGCMHLLTKIYRQPRTPGDSLTDWRMVTKQKVLRAGLSHTPRSFQVANGAQNGSNKSFGLYEVCMKIMKFSDYELDLTGDLLPIPPVRIWAAIVHLRLIQ